MHAGDTVFAFVASANTDEESLPDAGEVRWTARPTRTSRSAAASTAASAPTSPGWSLRTALRAWHVRIPHYRVKPGFDISHTVGIRSLDSFPMLLGQSA